jgi:hypothetical protein
MDFYRGIAMETSMTSHSKLTPERILFGAQVALFIGVALMIVSALHPDVRANVRGAFIKDFRVVVSTAQGKLAGDERTFTVAKVKTRDMLSLEIYESLQDGAQRLVEKIDMPDVKDGFFNFNGQATNLAIDDIDGDGRPEILAPTFDKNLVGRLNVYNYNPDNRSFNKLVQ